MIITRKGQSFEIKTGQSKVVLENDSIDIEGFKIDSPGEYERKGISVEAYSPGGSGLMFFITSEEMTLCYPDSVEVSTSLPESIKQIDVDLLLVSRVTKIAQDGKDKLLSEIDPKAVVLPEEVSNLGQIKQKSNQLRIKKADLPLEERDYYVLEE